jgi:hypothetical protein
LAKIIRDCVQNCKQRYQLCRKLLIINFDKKSVIKKCTPGICFFERNKKEPNSSIARGTAPLSFRIQMQKRAVSEFADNDFIN